MIQYISKPFKWFFKFINFDYTKFVLLSLLTWIMELMGYFFSAYAVLNTLPSLHIFNLMPIGTFSTLIPSAPGAIGTFEYFLSNTMHYLNYSEIDISLTNNQLDQNYDNQEEKKIFNTNEKLISDTIEDKNKTKKSFGISKFLSYLLVSIIFFIASIIVLDTFKSPLSNTIPGLEIFLYNFFETLKDLYLFIKNLFI